MLFSGKEIKEDPEYNGTVSQLGYNPDKIQAAKKLYVRYDTVSFSVADPGAGAFSIPGSGSGSDEFFFQIPDLGSQRAE